MKIRKAKISDVEAIHSLINQYAGEGVMLPKPRMALYENLRDFIVAEEDGTVLGVGALHIIWEDLAEIRSLAVDRNSCKKGIGKKIVSELISEAKELGICEIFTLTYKLEFFEKCGFIKIDKEDLPKKVWKDCINCAKFPNCDENAMINKIIV
ncbi:MAG: N-acetyltransferase [Deltaproteobacteria bacterium]